MQIENEQAGQNEAPGAEMVIYSCRTHQEGHSSQEEADNCIANAMAGVKTEPATEDRTQQNDRPQQQDRRQDRRPPQQDRRYQGNRPDPSRAQFTQAKGGNTLADVESQVRISEKERSDRQRLELVNKLAVGLDTGLLTEKAASFILDHYFDPRTSAAGLAHLARRMVGMLPDPQAK